MPLNPSYIDLILTSNPHSFEISCFFESRQLFIGFSELRNANVKSSSDAFSDFTDVCKETFKPEYNF